MQTPLIDRMARLQCVGVDVAFSYTYVARSVVCVSVMPMTLSGTRVSILKTRLQLSAPRLGRV